MTDQTASPARGLRALYGWMLRNAQGKHAWAALACFAFAEASFFPIPPDVMLLPMMLADRKRAFRMAAWCTLWSVIGGMLGYAIGAFFWDTAGLWIIHMLHVPVAKVEALRAEYTRNAAWIIVQGLTPVPYKLVTISSGLAGVPFAVFMLFSAITRTLRFVVLEGLLVYWFGAQAKAILDKYMEAALIIFLIAVVLGVVLVAFVLK
ncbi:MAG: DedA family protein [Alphaproteobacteria bacterium]|nr:DedA family protein [Alphaproteobacteria bacterium]